MSAVARLCSAEACKKRDGLSMAKLCPKEDAVLGTLKEKQVLSKWFRQDVNWFVLFVQTHKEDIVVERIQMQLDPAKYSVFCPTKDYAFKKRGAVLTRKVPWLTGYVFIVAKVDEQEFLDTIKPVVKQDSSIFRLLSNGGITDTFKMSERDKAIMTVILNENFNIPALDAIIEEGRVKIINDSALEGIGGRVKKVNKHKRTAVMEINMFGRTINCEVMLRYLA